MMKTTEEAIVRIPILRYDGPQNLDFNAWQKSFATSMGQKYGELAQVYRTGKAFEYDIPVRTMRSLATQSSLGYKIDADIDQAIDFAYKLDRKTFQTMITNID